jgi:hypothetical protein
MGGFNPSHGVDRVGRRYGVNLQPLVISDGGSPTERSSARCRRTIVKAAS